MRSASPLHQISSVPAIRSTELTPIGAKKNLPRFKFPLSCFAFSIIICLFLSSCGAPQTETKKDSAGAITNQNPKNNSAPQIKTVITPIGSSGFSVELPVSHHIETHQNKDFTIVYYITPSDTVANPGEAGMYFGQSPNVKPPSAEYTAAEIDTVFLGKKQKWIEYKTALYTQRETFIDENNGQYIHFWCYSNQPEELDRLFKMMLSIARKE